jgi:hypothetical protein
LYFGKVIDRADLPADNATTLLPAGASTFFKT